MSPLEALATGDGQQASRPIITITEAALGKLLELRAEESDADQLGLRLAIASGPGEDFRYDLSFDEYLKAAFTDEVRTHEGADESIKVIVPGDDVELLQDATLDYTDSQGLVIRNPNRPQAPDIEGLTNDDELSAEIEALVSSEVNPALAARANPVATWIGATGGEVAAGMLGAVAGSRIAQRIEPRKIQIASAVLFAGFGVVLIVAAW